MQSVLNMVFVGEWGFEDELFAQDVFDCELFVNNRCNAHLFENLVRWGLICSALCRLDVNAL